MTLQEAHIFRMFQENKFGGDKMKDSLYHIYLPEGHINHVPINEILSNGINHTIKSNNWYTHGGRVELDVTEHFRPFNVPSYVNFTHAIGVDVVNQSTQSFCFPVFTTEILVFDGDISLSIYDQAFYENFKNTDVVALNFDTGEKLEYWIKLYWDSMTTLDEYQAKKPYPKPEVLIFKPIPKEIIKLCEN